MFRNNYFDRLLFSFSLSQLCNFVVFSFNVCSIFSELLSACKIFLSKQKKVITDLKKEECFPGFLVCLLRFTGSDKVLSDSCLKYLYM